MKSSLFLLAMAINLSAVAQTKFGSWQYVPPTTTDGLQVAKTVNSAGSAAGVFCDPDEKKCNAYISIDLSCTDKAEYPMMVNSASGSNNLIGTCFHIEKVPYLLIDDYAAALSSFKSGGEISFAIPTDSGKFRVIRFDGSGAHAAIELARTLPEQTAKQNSNSSL